MCSRAVTGPRQFNCSPAYIGRAPKKVLEGEGELKLSLLHLWGFPPTVMDNVEGICFACNSQSTG